MTVLGLKLSRRANAVSALHGEVSRAMWTGLYPGPQPRTTVPIGHITNGVHVPTWLAPQMLRLYDRHLGRRLAPAQRRGAHLGGHRERGRRRAVGDPPQPEGAPPRVRAPARRRAGRAPRRADGRARSGCRRVLEPRRADHRLCAPLRHLQARQPDPARPRAARRDGQRPEAAGAVRLRRQGASARRARQARAAADRAADARPDVRRQVRLRRGLRHQRRPRSRAGRGRLAEQPAAAARSLGHQRPEGGAERRARTCRCSTAGGPRPTTG